MKIPSVFVLDASALLKPFLDEEGMEIVEKIINLKNKFQISLLVPDIFRYEFLNAMAREFGKIGALEAYERLIEKQLSILPLELDIIATATELMRKYPKISFYDAAYHALAIVYQMPFITADEKYYQTAKNEGNVELLEHLEIAIT